MGVRESLNYSQILIQLLPQLLLGKHSNNLFCIFTNIVIKMIKSLEKFL